MHLKSEIKEWDSEPTTLIRTNIDIVIPNDDHSAVNLEDDIVDYLTVDSRSAIPTRDGEKGHT